MLGANMGLRCFCTNESETPGWFQSIGSEHIKSENTLNFPKVTLGFIIYPKQTGVTDTITTKNVVIRADTIYTLGSE